jgi:hypothetical protein
MKPDLESILTAIRSREQLHLDDTQLDQVLAWWQRALGLDAWSIELRRQRGFRMGDDCGRCTYEISNRSATINLIFHEDCAPEDVGFDDEQVIVHELLHLNFAAAQDALRTRDPKCSLLEFDLCIEQPIDWLASLLVTLRRAPRGTNP